MRHDESLYPTDWLRIAERDLIRVNNALKFDDPSQAGFYLQQATEKFLKAFLLARGWSLRRIHDLGALLDDAVGFEPALNYYRLTCERITAYYILERYPAVSASSISDNDVRQSRNDVMGLIDRIRSSTP